MIPYGDISKGVAKPHCFVLLKKGVAKGYTPLFFFFLCFACSVPFCYALWGGRKMVQIGQMEPAGVTRRRTRVRREVTFVRNARQ